MKCLEELRDVLEHLIGVLLFLALLFHFWERASFDWDKVLHGLLEIFVLVGDQGAHQLRRNSGRKFRIDGLSLGSTNVRLATILNGKMRVHEAAQV